MGMEWKCQGWYNDDECRKQRKATDRFPEGKKEGRGGGLFGEGRGFLARRKEWRCPDPAGFLSRVCE